MRGEEGRKKVFFPRFCNWTALFLLIFAWSFLFPLRIEAAPVSESQVHRAASTWLGLSDTHLEEALGENIQSITRYDDDQGEPLYYIVYLNPQGFLVVAGDDLVEPIIAMVPRGTEYVPAQDNPLGALVTNDLAGRVGMVRDIQSQGKGFSAASSLQKQNAEKWISLLERGEYTEASSMEVISDVRVVPLVRSKWGQSNEDGGSDPPYLYNNWTPNHYVCGCVATAMAQIMRFYEYPTEGVGSHEFEIEIDGQSAERSTRGGDGDGGPYDWANMPLDPQTADLTDVQRQAIGALTYDAGVAAKSSYTSSETSSYVWKASEAFLNVFGYKNVVCAWGFLNFDEEIRNSMVLPNLDAGNPVYFSIHSANSDAGHAVLADGYGYDDATLYHHINMGWYGSDNVWYNLPNVTTSYNVVKGVLFNIFTNGVGEIISGRVVDDVGQPIPRVTVTLSGGGLSGDRKILTDTQGIYAFENVSSDETYAIAVTKQGVSFAVASRNVSVGTSESSTLSFLESVGNVWGVNFQGIPSVGARFYVDADASGACDGSSWGNAYTDLQDALGSAGEGTEIWVAEGSYKPSITGNPGESFVLRNDVGIYGGFTGNETSREERDPEAHVTILTGDLLGNDVFDAAEGGYQGGTGEDNSYQVVRGGGSNSTAILDGFTVTGGNAPFAGGGMQNNRSDPFVRNCIFTQNAALVFGGGMANFSSNPSLDSCTFSENVAKQFGGGTYNDSSNPSLSNCVFVRNVAVYWGGGMYNEKSNPSLSFCEFRENLVENGGAAICNNSSSPSINNCFFSKNESSQVGAGMFNMGEGSPNVTCCVFEENFAGDLGGAVLNVCDATFTRCGFLRNKGSDAGAVFFDGDQNCLKLQNCTFAENIASKDGGGVSCNGGNLVITNSTFLNNNASGNGGAVSVSSDTTTAIANCIFWDNMASCGAQIFHSSGTLGIATSVIQSADGSIVVGDNASIAYTTSAELDIITGNPNLGALADNGGLTKTCLLGSGSSALNKGLGVGTHTVSGIEITIPDIDQRGVERPQGAGVDIGAVEMDGEPPAPPVTEYRFVAKWGSLGNGEGEFLDPHGAEIDGLGYIYVVDVHNNRIQKFDSSGVFITTWGSGGDDGEGKFNNPVNIAIDSANNIYVTDAYGNRIQKFDSSGNFLLEWGSYGTGEGRFNLPFGITIDDFGNVYVADYNNDRIQKFTSSGTFIDEWGSRGTGNGQFYKPHGIAVDEKNNIYVVEYGNNRIQKFTSSGVFITVWGSLGTGDGQFRSPRDVKVDNVGNVYVTDTGNHRIQKFTASGSFIAKWGRSGSGDGLFNEPKGIAIDSLENIYIVDCKNNRVQKFTSLAQCTLTTTINGPDQATWSIDGEGGHAGGATVTVEAGSHTVSFSAISGWTKPANQTVTVTEGENASCSGTYTLAMQKPTSWSSIQAGDQVRLEWPPVEGFSGDVSYTVRIFDAQGELVEVRITSNPYITLDLEAGQEYRIRVDVEYQGVTYTGEEWIFTPKAPQPESKKGSWVIGTNGNTYRYEDGSWTWTPAKANYLAAVDEDTCWISQTGSETLYKYDNGTWTWTPAKSKWITAYGADTLWLVQATSGTLYRYESGSWIWTPAKAKNISAPSSDVLWLIQQSSENLYRYTISSNTWEWTPGKAKSISAATEDIVWIVGLNDTLYKYDHSTEDWTWHNVQAQAVSAISETEVLLVNPSGKLCRFKDGVVSVIGGSCKDLSAYPIPASSESVHSSGSGNSDGETAYPEGGCSMGTGIPLLFALLLLLPWRDK